MKSIFVLILLLNTSTVFAADLPLLFHKISQLNCQASKLVLGSTMRDGDIKISIDTSEDLLIEATFPSDSSKNFKIGQRFSAGRDLRDSDRDKCQYFYAVESDVAAQVKYVCADTEEPSPIARDGFSKFFYRANLASGVICKAPLACWEITNCR